jgi:hypothetical protein
VADPWPGPGHATRWRDRHQQRVGRIARPDRRSSRPADGRRRGRHRPVTPSRRAASRGPAQGRPSRQQDRDDAGVRRRNEAAGRDRVRGCREPVRPSGQGNARPSGSVGRARAANRPRRDGGRRLRARRDDCSDGGCARDGSCRRVRHRSGTPTCRGNGAGLPLCDPGDRAHPARCPGSEPSRMGLAGARGSLCTRSRRVSAARNRSERPFVGRQFPLPRATSGGRVPSRR